MSVRHSTRSARVIGMTLLEQNIHGGQLQQSQQSLFPLRLVRCPSVAQFRNYDLRRLCSRRPVPYFPMPRFRRQSMGTYRRISFATVRYVSMQLTAPSRALAFPSRVKLGSSIRCMSGSSDRLRETLPGSSQHFQRSGRMAPARVYL
jgi:hypothetical protein